MATAIEFNHVGKQYRLGLVSTGTISHDLNRWWQTAILRKEDPYLKIGSVNDRTQKADSDYVWALRDIDFKVEQGDVVGIIGKNGAGKSTLLKLLSKVTAPTVGTIRARGRIASLLEVGTGFHQEMTGRENIYMNGAILGMTKREIAAKLDEIVDFSGCERYLDTPVKRYSSGMMVRLGFAVAAHLDPEILVVDEVLAVGDAEFQKKAIGKMQDVSRGEGRTVLFVSHNMDSIRQLCTKGVLLENGCVRNIGNVNQIVNEYLDINSTLCDNNNLFFEDINTALGNDNIRIKSFNIKSCVGNYIDVKSGFEINLCFKNYVKNALIDACFSFETREGVVALQKSSVISPNCDSKEGYYHIKLHIPGDLLNAGEYKLKLWFGQSREYLLWGSLEQSISIEEYIDPSQGYFFHEAGILYPSMLSDVKFSEVYSIN